MYDDAIAIQRRLLGSDPSNTVVATNLMGGLGTKASALIAQGDAAGALAAYREAVSIGSNLDTQGKRDPHINALTAALAQLLAQALLKQQEFDEATNALAFSIKTYEDLMAQDPPNLDYPSKLADAVSAEGDLLCGRHKCQEGINRYQRALALRQQAADGTSVAQQLLANDYYKLGQGLAQVAQSDKAHAAYRAGEQLLLNLRAAGQLSDTAEGYRLYLPQLQRALGAQH